MKTFLRSLSILVLAAAAAAPASAGPCVGNIQVSLMTPGKIDTVHRREFVEISSDLAADLGIHLGEIDPDADAPNPQIRLRIHHAPAASGIEINSAVFTVVKIRPVFQNLSPRVWVYARSGIGDKDAGQFKLFAKSDNSILSTPDVAPDDGILDDVRLQAFPIPVSSSELTSSAGITTSSTFDCAPATLPAKRYVEKAVRADNDLVVALAPHGGDIETETSGQVDAFATAFDGLAMTAVNKWKLEGYWGNTQTFQRWHITSTSFDVASYPGLTSLLPPTGSFEHAVAFHGFGGSSAACMGTPDDKRRELILGGRAPQKLKCAIAAKIVDAMDATASLTGAIAISIRHYGGVGSIEIKDLCGNEVSVSGISGIGEDNIVNRLASNGGIQLEQSSSLRAHGTLRNLVTNGTAAGLAQFLADPVTDYCSPFD